MKRAFDLNEMLPRIEKAIAPYPKAAMFELAERGYNTLFEQLISCLISIRTLDETTIPLSLKLFNRARTPEQLLAIPFEELAEMLVGSQYPGQKAETMRAIAQIAVTQYGGKLPADYDQLTALKGVGPKCANLALGVATGVPAISVDVHVHRVVNRWGFVKTTTPEKTLKVLENKVPQSQWIDINRLLMPFGKHICTGPMPRCSRCPVLEFCEQVGVTSHR